MRAQRKLINQDTLNGLLELMDNDYVVLRRALEEYYFSVEEGIKEIRNARNQGRYDEISLIAHGIKGASYNMGADAVAEIAYYIEKNPISINDSDIENLQSVLLETKKEMENILKMIKKNE